MIRVKVCCISSIEEARLAVRRGASALGLVSEMPSGPGVVSEALITEIAATGRHVSSHEPDGPEAKRQDEAEAKKDEAVTEEAPSGSQTEEVKTEEVDGGVEVAVATTESSAEDAVQAEAAE